VPDEILAALARIEPPAPEDRRRTPVKMFSDEGEEVFVYVAEVLPAYNRAQTQIVRMRAVTKNMECFAGNFAMPTSDLWQVGSIVSMWRYVRTYGRYYPTLLRVYPELMV
jgi:hypothetical protein